MPQTETGQKSYALKRLSRTPAVIAHARPVSRTRVAWIRRLTRGGQFAIASSFGSLNTQTIPPWFR
jgi:hypothetical protein